MISPEWSAAHQRGFEHYKKARYEEAIAAFTEAIRIDPEAPRSYIARALCYRRLDQPIAAQQDQQTAEDLGGPEKSLWDMVINRSRRRWRFDFSDPNWIQADPLSRKAALLRILDAQILNGGLCQWVANGYWRWIDDAIEAARDVGTDSSREVAALLEEISLQLEGLDNVLEWQEDDVEGQDHEIDQDSEAMRRLFDCEDRYYKVQSQFIGDVETWLEGRLNTHWH